MHNLIKVKVEGKNVNNYLKWLIKNKVHIYKLNIKGSNNLYLVIDYKDYDKLLNYSKSYEITILKYYGTRKYLNSIHRNRIILISLFISIILLFVLSRMIFSIDIVYNDKDMISLVKEELGKHEIKRFRFKKNFNELSKIKKEILDDNKDRLEWIEIIESGTKYIVKLVERNKEVVEKSFEYQSVVASKNAIITSIKASNGEKVKEVNDYVKKGEVIISGILTEPSGDIIYKKAKGRVLGEVWYKLEVDYPFCYKEEKLTGKKKEGYVINFLNKRIPLLGYSSYHTYEKDTNTIFENNIFPFSFIKEKQYETLVKEEIYTPEEVVNHAIEYAKDKLLKNNNKISEVKKALILDKKINSSNISLKFFVSVIEDITKIEEINIYN